MTTIAIPARRRPRKKRRHRTVIKVDDGQGPR